jgi:hypothetical protein
MSSKYPETLDELREREINIRRDIKETRDKLKELEDVLY